MPTTRAYDRETAFVKAAETDLVPTVGTDLDVDLGYIRLVNTDQVDHTITVYKYKPPTVKGVERIILGPTFTIPPQSPYELGPVIVPEGYKVTAEADEDDKITYEPGGWVTDFS